MLVCSETFLLEDYKEIAGTVRDDLKSRGSGACSVAASETGCCRGASEITLFQF